MTLGVELGFCGLAGGLARTRERVGCSWTARADVHTSGARGRHALDGRGNGGLLDGDCSPAQRFCRSSTRRIFPLTVLGSSVTKASELATLALRTTKALMRWPSFSSGTPTTADSATAGCSRSADSTSN